MSRTEFTKIVPATFADGEALRPVLESSVGNTTKDGWVPIYPEIDAIVRSVQESTRKPTGRTYLIARRESGVAVGMMGLQELPEEDSMRDFGATDNPAEIINAYVDPRSRGEHVGRSLVAGLESLARQARFTELIVNSGPRYAKTGHGFWNRVFEYVGAAENYYGKGYAAEVWHKVLATEIRLTSVPSEQVATIIAQAASYHWGAVITGTSSGPTTLATE